MGRCKVTNTIFYKYKASKSELKIIERDLEIYKNNYKNLEEEYCTNMINKLQEKRDHINKFISKYDAIYEKLSECEKIYIVERYYKQKNVYELEEYFKTYCKDIVDVLIENRKYLDNDCRYPFNLLYINAVIVNKFSVLDKYASK